MRSSSETARSRRASYQNQRSHTLDTLPLQLIHPAPLLSLTDQRNSLDSQDEAGSASEESRLLGSTEGSPFHASRDNCRSSRENHPSGGHRGPARLTLTKNLSFQNVLSENALNHQRLPGGGGSTRSARVFLRKSSDNDLLYGGGCSSTSTRILERSPSSSSALLAKVKDRIVDTFFQTSSEGPHLAAIVQERRQRAAEEYEARLSIFRAQQHQQHHQQLQTSRPGSLSSDSGSTERFPASHQSSTRRNRTQLAEASLSPTGDTDAIRFAKSRRDGARAAFRRRSVSEDNCLPLQSHLAKTRPVGNGSVASSQAGLGGIVCSTDDFQALVSGLGHRRGLSFGGSRSRCMGPRAMSFDQSRQLRPSGSLFGDYPSGDGASQRLNNSSKILETSEEVADSSPHHDHHITRRPEESASHRNRKNPLDTTGDRLSKDSSTVSTDEVSSHHHQQPGTTEVVSSSNSESGSSHVPLVPEVEFDANGQTWDVYGAELDPEILGSAIQLHLSRLIARTKAAAADDVTTNNHDHLMNPGGRDVLVTCPPSPRDRQSSVFAKGSDVPRGRDHAAEIGCLRRYFCVFSASDDS